MNFNIIFKVAFWRGVAAILSFLTIAVSMKYLSVEQFADYSFAFTIYTAACLLPSLGLNKHLVLEEGRRDLLKKNDNIKIYFTLVVFISFLLNYFNLINDIIYYAITAGIFSSVIDYNLSKLQAKKRFKLYAILMPARTFIIFIVVIISLLYIKENKVENIYKICSIIFLIIYILFIYKNIDSSFYKVKTNLLIYKSSISFLIFELAALVMMRSEVWVLTFYSTKGYLDKGEIANYWAAFNFMLIISMLSSTLANILLPFIKESKKDNFNDVNRMVFRVSFLMVIFLIISVFFSYILSRFYFDQSYQKLPYYVFYLGLGIFASFIANIERLKLMVHSENNQKADKMVLVQLLLSIILNFILIYLYGIWGAIATFVIVRILGLMIFKYYGNYYETSSKKNS